MSEKLIKVHVGYLRDWLKNEEFRDIHSRIALALERIKLLESVYRTEDIIIIKKSEDIDENLHLPERIGAGNLARLVGTRRKVCILSVENILLKNDIPYILDEIGIVD